MDAGEFGQPCRGDIYVTDHVVRSTLAVTLRERYLCAPTAIELDIDNGALRAVHIEITGSYGTELHQLADRIRATTADLLGTPNTKRGPINITITNIVTGDPCTPERGLPRTLPHARRRPAADAVVATPHPIEGEPADVVAVVNDYGKWFAESDVPKLFINTHPARWCGVGFAISSAAGRTRPNHSSRRAFHPGGAQMRSARQWRSSCGHSAQTATWQ